MGMVGMVIFFFFLGGGGGGGGAGSKKPLIICIGQLLSVFCNGYCVGESFQDYS